MPSSPISTAQEYFNLSNNSNFAGIAKLMNDETTYFSKNSGIFLGVKDIIAMQKNWHSSFTKLHWQIINITEIKPNIVLIDYNFLGTKQDNTIIKSSGLEYIIVKNNIIVHIQIQPK